MKPALNVLLVEDNEGDVEMTVHAFEEGKTACQVSVVNDGIEALDFLHKRENYISASTPDLILLDLNMPRMDGKQFLEVVKKEPKLKTIPVVMLTSSQSPTDIRECYERNASCYVVKPFDSDEFAKTVQQVLDFWGTLGQLPAHK